MHIITAYAIYDNKAEIYDTPVFFLNETQAQRWFYTLIQSGEGRFAHYKDEMELHRISKFNVNTANTTEDIKKIIEGKQIQQQIKIEQMKGE